jgi:hypothetical protein
MTTAQKSPKGTAGRKQSSTAGRVLSPKKAAKNGVSEIIGARQLQQADEMLTRIERRGEALSATADMLLRRVS